MNKATTIKTVFCLLLLGVLLSQFGCNSVRRRMYVTSYPSEAMVYLNEQEVGKTPIAVNVVYSGTYKIRCIKEGFDTETVMYKMGTPWYLWPGVDFFSENFVPGEISDLQACHINLTPRRLIPPDEIVEEAQKLRNEAQAAADRRTSGSQ